MNFVNYIHLERSSIFFLCVVFVSVPRNMNNMLVLFVVCFTFSGIKLGTDLVISEPFSSIAARLSRMWWLCPKN